jgi:hypothetical protein
MMKKAMLLASALAGTVVSTGDLALADNAALEIPIGICEPSEGFQRLLATAMLPLIPREQREQIIAAGGLGAEGYNALRIRTGDTLVAHDDRYERIREFVSPALFARMNEVHLDAMLHLLDRQESGEPPLKYCFAPDTDPELVAAFSRLFEEQFWGGGDNNGERYQITNRWSATATNGFSTGGQGGQITLTYSFPPDGALGPNLSGALRPNQLFAWMNSLYGTPATWQQHFHNVFARWGELSGVTYVHELNDDGANGSTASGSLGVRGDIRIFGIPLDGNNGVLAYNPFPNDGDMYLDAFDSFYNSTTQNSRRLRNVAAHEHGHGLGILHVCPANSTKLMEPFVTTAYDGPQLDDILAVQRHYGDPFEPTDNAAQAHDLGNVFVGFSTQLTNLSIDGNSDIDFFRINVTQPLEITATATPDAASYSQGPQTSSCNTGTITDYNAMRNLVMQVRASNGTTILANANNTPAGQPETVSFTILNPGTYYVVVDDSTTANNIQRYRLNVTGASIPFDGPTIVAQDNPPFIVPPGQAVVLDYEVLPNQDSIIDGPDLFYRFGAGAYTSVPMSNLGGNIYRATIPAAACGDSPEFYISVVGQVVGEVNLPAAGVNAPFAYSVGALTVLFEDDFEINRGWSTFATATAGQWVRGVPVPSTGAPSADYDGSGSCYITGNTAGVDVDGGRAFLTSPPLDLEDGGIFSYAYWFGGTPGTGDNLTLQISTDGQFTWTNLKTYTTDSGGWQVDTVEIDAATGVANTYFRFFAEDTGFDNLVEAAIDAVTVGEITCTTPGGCNPADLVEPFGILDLADINAFINAFVNQQPLADLAPPVGVFDLQDIAVFTASFVAGCP